MKYGTVYEAVHAEKMGGPPRRMFQEMADEFGVSHSRLLVAMQRLNGPKPTRKSPHYYKPVEMREWWARVKDLPIPPIKRKRPEITHDD